MGWKDEIDSDLREMEFESGSPVFTWFGNDYPCTESSFDATATIDEGGTVIEVTASIHVRMVGTIHDDCLVWDFSVTGPEEGQQVIFNSKTYKIVRVVNIGGKALTLHLGDLTK